MRNHVVITGTGRAGTTFLIELLTKLGLDTGFAKDDLAFHKHELSHGGLERDIRKDDCPFVVKSPWFCDYVEDVLAREDIAIDHVFIPIRDLHSAAESRRNISSRKIKDGGLWDTKSHKPGEQESILAGKMYNLLFAVSDAMIPITFLRYPKIVKDCSYLFRKIDPVFQGISFDSFCAEWHATVRPELVHRFGDKDC